MAREKGGWQGPFRLLAMEGETYTLAMPRGPAKFRSSSVRPYLQDTASAKAAEADDLGTARDEPTTAAAAPQIAAAARPHHEAAGLMKPLAPDHHDEEQGLGAGGTSPERCSNVLPSPGRRPERRRLENIAANKALLTDTAVSHEKPQVRRSGRPRKPKLIDAGFTAAFFGAASPSASSANVAFMTTKERNDHQLAIEPRNQGTITTPGLPFEESSRAEIDNLIARGVFHFEKYDDKKHRGIRLFGSRLVNEIKGKGTGSPYEKSRLVIRGFNDEGNDVIITASPTIQRSSQRILLALAPSLAERGIFVWSRDITQAYTQSTTNLQRTIMAKIPSQIKGNYPEGTVIMVAKPLYGIAEAGTHWWMTYSQHHREKLAMKTSTFDPYLLVSKGQSFGLIGMQTDDTLGVSD